MSNHSSSPGRRVGCRSLLLALKHPGLGCWHYENESCDCDCHVVGVPSIINRDMRHYDMRVASRLDDKAKIHYVDN